MDSMNNWALKFIRWGMGLTILGLVTGYLPLGHYLMVGAIPSCPAAPIHGHTVLLSFVGMTVFGLVYHVLPSWMGATPPPLALIRTHFWLSVAGVIGVCVNGTLVYEVITHLQPRFYYIGVSGTMARNIWFGLDGFFLTLYGIGSVIFLFIVLTRTSYARAGSRVETNAGRMAREWQPRGGETA